MQKQCKERWAAALGEESGIRLCPNWWWIHSNEPHLPLEEIASFLKFAWENRLDSIRMDSINGFWGTKGPSYYLVARMMMRPDLGKEEILAEYTSAFGKGAPAIREYLEYWQKLTTEYDQLTSSVPEVRQFFDEVKSGQRQAFLNSSSKAALLVPSLYPDAVIAPGEALLRKAESLLEKGEDEARQGISFLQSGLDELRLSRDTIALGMRLDEEENPTPELFARFREKAEQLAALRRELTPPARRLGRPRRAIRA